jgi:DNA invertase Pin-like site-specific DNA recombinase
LLALINWKRAGLWGEVHRSSISDASSMRTPGASIRRNLILEHTLAGLKAARARDRKGRRKPSLFPKDIKTVRALLKTREMTVGETAERLNVARSTIIDRITRERSRTIRRRRGGSLANA